MARLVVESGDEAGVVYGISHKPVLIGRGVECIIRVPDRRVSRHHARIWHDGKGFVLEDLQSRNGTFLNHQGVNSRVRLRSGDCLAVGGASFLFELDVEDRAKMATLLARVRLSGGQKHEVQAEKPLEGDTAPVSSQTPVSPELFSQAAQRLKLLYRVGDALRGELDTENLLTKLMDLIWRVMLPDRGIILLYDDEVDDLQPVVVKTTSDGDGDIVVSKAIVKKCLADESAILLQDAPADPRFENTESMIASAVRSVICAPLVAQGTQLGVIYVDTQAGGDSDTHRAWTADDLELMTGISNQAALALENARLHQEALKHQKLERELEIARNIQDQLLPRTYPNTPGMEFGGVCQPARQVGGDYFDFFELPGGRVAAVLADATGKGVPAAISVAMLRAAVRTRLKAAGAKDLGAMMSELNTAICQDAISDNYITMFVLIYDITSRSATYCNAGHVPPILLRANEQLEMLTEGGMLLGAVPETNYQTGQVDLSTDDVVVLYSDGVTDTHSLAGELYSREKLVESIRESRTESARKICDYICTSVVRFRETREAFDDLTLVVMKVKDAKSDPQYTLMDE